MSASVKALLWEQWRQTRQCLILLFLVVAVDVTVLILCRFPDYFRRSDLISLADFYVAGALLITIAMLLTHVNRGTELEFGWARRLHRLPLSTMTLANAVFAWRFLFALMLFAAALGVHAACFSGETILALLPALAGTLAVLFLFTALNAVTGAFGGRVQALTALLVAILFGFSISSAWALLSAYPLAVLFCAAAVAYPAMLWGTALNRRGGAAIFVTAVPRTGARRLAEIPSFEDARAAQRWFEARRHGWVLPVFSAVLWAIFIGIRAFDFHPGRGAVGLFDILASAAVPASYIAALIFALMRAYGDYRDNSGAMGRFLAVRPVSPSILGNARFHAGARSALSTLVLLLAISILALLFIDSPTIGGTASWGVSSGMPGALYLATLVLYGAFWALGVWAIAHSVNRYTAALFSLWFLLAIVPQILIPNYHSRYWGFGEYGYPGAEGGHATLLLMLAGLAAAHGQSLRMGLIRLRVLLFSLLAVVAILLTSSIFLYSSFEFGLWIVVLHAPLPPHLAAVIAGIALAAVPLALHRRRSASRWAIPLDSTAAPPPMTRGVLLRAAICTASAGCLFALYHAVLNQRVQRNVAEGIQAAALHTQESWDALLAAYREPRVPAAGIRRLWPMQPSQADAYFGPGDFRVPRRNDPIDPESRENFGVFLPLANDLLHALEVPAAGARAWTLMQAGWPQLYGHDAVWTPELVSENMMIREALTLLLFAANLHAEGGGTEQAAQFMRAALVLKRGLDNEPALVIQRQRHAWGNAASQALESMLNRCSLSTAQARSLIDVLPRAISRTAWKAAMAAHASIALPVFDGAENPWWQGGNLNLDWFYQSAGFQSVMSFETAWYRGSGIRQWDKLYFLNRQHIDLSRASMDRSLCQLEAPESWRWRDRHLIYRWSSPIAASVYLPQEPFRRAISQSELHTQLMRVALGVVAYRTDRGELPQRLVQLVPDYLDSLPEDPCGDADWDGEKVDTVQVPTPGFHADSGPRFHARPTFRYEPQPDGAFALYSVSSNHEDDNAFEPLQLGDRGDVVFRVPAPR